MKKYILISLLGLSLLGGNSNLVFAQAKDPLLSGIANETGYTKAGQPAPNLSETVGKIIRIILGLLGIIFLGLTVYAGALWMTAAGEEEKVTAAMGILKMAVIGLIIILASYSLSYFVLDKIFEATL